MGRVLKTGMGFLISGRVFLLMGVSDPVNMDISLGMIVDGVKVGMVGPKGVGLGHETRVWALLVMGAKGVAEGPMGVAVVVPMTILGIIGFLTRLIFLTGLEVVL